MKHLAKLAQAIAFVTAAAIFSGCVTLKVVEYKSFHSRQFSARSKPAQVQEKATAELLAGGYLLIGYIDLRRNIQSCYTDDLCTKHSYKLPANSELQQEAARRGGDVLTVLEERTVLEDTARTDCTGYYTYTTFINNVSTVHTNCAGYRTTAGKLEAKVSRALIWRYEPDAANSDANAQAIEAAMQTLETVARKDAAPTVSGVDSLMTAMLGGNTKKPDTSAQVADALSRRIYTAISLNDRETLNLLARDGSLHQWTDGDGLTALMVALASEHPDTARTLIAMDAGIARHDRQGRTALHYAIMYSDRAMIEDLLNAGYSLKDKPKDSAPLLFYSVVNKNEAVYEWLVTQGLDPRERDAYNQTLLTVAAEVGRPAMLARFIKLGMDPNHRDSEGQTPLMSAARGGQVETTQALLKAGARPATTDNQNRTALHFGAYGGETEVLRVLLDRKLSVNAEDKEGRSPLIEALVADRWAAMEYLLDHGATLETSKIGPSVISKQLLKKDQPLLLKRYVTAYPLFATEIKSENDWLHMAARESGAATIKYLVAAGANVDGPSGDSVSPLMTAATEGNADAARALLECKADATLRDTRNRTALQIAIQSGHADVVAALRKFGVTE